MASVTDIIGLPSQVGGTQCLYGGHICAYGFLLDFVRESEIGACQGYDSVVFGIA